MSEFELFHFAFKINNNQPFMNKTFHTDIIKMFKLRNKLMRKETL